MKVKIGGATLCLNDLEEEMEKVKSVGYDFAEIDVTLIEPDEKFIDILSRYKDDLPSPVAHLPTLEDEEQLEKSKAWVKILSKTGVQKYITHIPFGRKIGDIDQKPLLEKLAAFMENREEKLLLENMVQTTESVVKALEEFPSTGLCLDVGHANIAQDENISLELLEMVPERVEHLHFHDNRGGGSTSWDLHLPIGVGDIDFRSITEKLKEIGYSGLISMEIGTYDEGYQRVSLKKVKQMIEEV